MARCQRALYGFLIAAFAFVGTVGVTSGNEARSTRYSKDPVSFGELDEHARRAALVAAFGGYQQFTQEITCIALAVMVEARGEPWKGKVAVTQVIIERTHSPKYPDTPCKVIRQPGQFQWTANWKPGAMKFTADDVLHAFWAAMAVLEGTVRKPLPAGSMFFCAWRVEGACNWHRKALQKAAVIGGHLFLSEPKRS